MSQASIESFAGQSQDRRGSVLMTHYHSFINGNFSASSSSTQAEATNPSTGEPICTVSESSDADVPEGISSAESAQREQSRRPAIERARILR